MPQADFLPARHSRSGPNHESAHVADFQAGTAYPNCRAGRERRGRYEEGLRALRSLCHRCAHLLRGEAFRPDELADSPVAKCRVHYRG